MYFQWSILSLQHLRDCLVNVLVYSVTGILFSSAGEHAFSQCVHHHHSSCSSNPYCSPHDTSNQHAYHTSCHHYSRHQASTLVSTVYQYMLQFSQTVAQDLGKLVPHQIFGKWFKKKLEHSLSRYVDQFSAANLMGTQCTNLTVSQDAEDS